jgi:hypothetical protein
LLLISGLKRAPIRAKIMREGDGFSNQLDGSITEEAPIDFSDLLS